MSDNSWKGHLMPQTIPGKIWVPHPEDFGGEYVTEKEYYGYNEWNEDNGNNGNNNGNNGNNNGNNGNNNGNNGNNGNRKNALPGSSAASNALGGAPIQRTNAMSTNQNGGTRRRKAYRRKTQRRHRSYRKNTRRHRRR